MTRKRNATNTFLIISRTKLGYGWDARRFAFCANRHIICQKTLHFREKKIFICAKNLAFNCAKDF